MLEQDGLKGLQMVQYIKEQISPNHILQVLFVGFDS